MVLESTVTVDSKLSGCVFFFFALVEVLAVFSKSILWALLLNAVTRRSVVGFRHLTKNVSPSVLCFLLAVAIKQQ